VTHVTERRDIARIRGLGRGPRVDGGLPRLSLQGTEVPLLLEARGQSGDTILRWRRDDGA